VAQFNKQGFLGEFKTISRFLVVLNWKFLRLGKMAWDFLRGLIFGPGIFWGFVGSPRDFFGF